MNNQGVNAQGPASRRAPSWVRYPWYFLIYLNVLGGAFALAWWYGWIGVSGGNETAFGMIIAWAVVSAALLILSCIVTLVWISGSSEASEPPHSH